MIIFIIVISIIIGIFIGVVVTWHFLDKVIVNYSNLSDKHIELFNLLVLWVKMYQLHGKISDYLYSKNYKSIAIYGFGTVGELLLNEISSSNINIKYIIDKEKKYTGDIPLISPDDVFSPVDVIIVTPVYYYANIRNLINKKTKIKVVSLFDIFYEV